MDLNKDELLQVYVVMCKAVDHANALDTVVSQDFVDLALKIRKELTNSGE